jgi:hypothetical protein
MLFPFASSRTPRLDSLFKILLIILLGVALIFSGHVAVYGLIWYSARGLYVLAILTACYVLFRSFRADWISPRSQLLLLLAALAALVSWVQLPFAHAIYFCYTAPLGLLLFVGLVRMQPDAPRLLHLGVLCFYFLFALIWNNSAYVWYLGEGYLPYRADNVLRLDRAGIRVTDADNALYTELVALIRNRHGPSPYIYAAPDCAEVYYLSGMRNPTRKLYDFLSESENDAAKISERLEARKVNLVVINQEPHFSGKLRPDMLELLEARFPHAQTVGRFTVRWKE